MVTRVLKVSSEAYNVLVDVTKENGKSIAQIMSETIHKAVSEHRDELLKSIGAVEVGPLKKPVGIHDAEYRMLKEFVDENEKQFIKNTLRRVGISEVASIAVLLIHRRDGDL